MKQLSFPFQNQSQLNPYLEEDFLILPENGEIVNFLNKFFVQKNFASSNLTSVIIKGERASGKTHLLNIFAQQFGAEFLNHQNLNQVNPANFFNADKFYILEDLQEIKDEELVLRIVNSANEANAFLIITIDGDWQFKLKDLVSRLKNIFSLTIQNPSHESIKMLLTNAFSRRQIKLSRQVVDFLSNNIERSFAAVLDIVKLVELRVQESPDAAKIKEIRKIFF